MKNQTYQKNLLAQNIATLRNLHRLTLEEVAERVGVSRQAVAKWENGETTPDILNCDALAGIYNVSLDDLVHYDASKTNVPVPPPKNKHLFGTAQLGERGQIVLPKKARETFHLKAGDMLMVLGDTTPENAGIALVLESQFLQSMDQVTSLLKGMEREKRNGNG